MRWVLLLAFLAAAGCSKGPEADLQYIKQARSIGAEWALINEQAARNQLTGTYVSNMREWLRDQLDMSSNSVAQPNSPYAEEMKALLAEPDDASPQQVRAHVEKLKQIEDELESA